MKKLTCLCLLVVLNGSRADLPLQLPGPTVPPVVNNPRVSELLRKNQKVPTYAAYRELAELYVELGHFDEAAKAYRAEAALYRRSGLKNAALVQEGKAARYDTQARIFLERPLSAEESGALDTKARLEPPIGTYAGAYIDLDDKLPNSWVEPGTGRKHGVPTDFERVVGKKHGTYFMYLEYSRGVPYTWLKQCKDAGVVAQLAMEPNDLRSVQDNAYLRNFAKECARLRVPIFLRFGSEMNGTWVPWHGDGSRVRIPNKKPEESPYSSNPSLYKEKFRLVHKVFKQEAPLVATVWCPNSVPVDNILDYYPGDEHCDWVGVNVYSVPFYGNDPKRSGLMDSALTFIDPVYRMFSARKPIAICEFASSHMAEVDKISRPDWAISRMRMLYESLPRFYPRIKMISWFNVNTIRHGSPGTPNNYSLSENTRVLEAYREVIRIPYFLEGPVLLQTGLTAESRPFSRDLAIPRLVTLGEQIKGNAKFSVWIKTPVEQPKVYVAINNKLTFAWQGNGVHHFALNADELNPGPKRVRVYVYDNNRFISTSATTVKVGSARGGAVQVTGTVRRFYVDQAGMVSALDIETLGAVERVHFKPEQAKQLMAEFPPLGEITVWVAERDEQAVGITRSWSLVSTENTETPPPAIRVDVPGDLERLEGKTPGAAGGEGNGALTDVVQNAAGEIVALILDNATIVRVPPALRGDANATAVALGAKISVAGMVEQAAEGAVSLYAKRLSAATLTVNGQPAAAVKFAAKTSRGIRAVKREDEDQWLDDNVQNAQASGLDVYEPPLPAGSRFPIRGGDTMATARSLGVEPMVETSKRPW